MFFLQLLYNNTIFSGLIYDVLFFSTKATRVLAVTELTKKIHNFSYVGVLEIWKMKVKIRRKS
jgi:hypothetical protein